MAAANDDVKISSYNKLTNDYNTKIYILLEESAQIKSYLSNFKSK
jgi:hypothetical protein